MLSINLFVKTETRHLVCRPTLLPAAMAHSGALSPAPSRLRARPDKSLGILLNFWGVFQFTHTLPLPSPHKQR